MMVFALIFSLHGGAYAEENLHANTSIEENVFADDASKEGENQRGEEGREKDLEEKPEDNHEANLDKEEVLGISEENISDSVGNPEDSDNPDTETEEDGDKPVVPEDEEEGKNPNQEINPSDQADLSELDKQISEEEDPAKKAELEKKYNQKYAELLARTNKLDDSVLDRVKEKEKIDKYYELKAEYDAILEKLDSEEITSEENQKLREELDKLNGELFEYQIPRLLEDDEKDAQKELADSVDVPGLKDGATDDAKAKLDAYNKAKEALEKALDANKDRETSQEELEDLVKAFNDAQEALKEGIEKGKIDPSYTEGDPTVKVFPLNGGKLGDELKKEEDEEDETYYIPDNTNLDLLLHINKDDEPRDFTFTIKAIENEGVEIPNGTASKLAFLNGEPVELTKNDDGSYSFTVNSEETFGIAQLRFNMPGFKAAFHKGFDLEMTLPNADGNEQKITKQFRITKKGYEDQAHLGGPGSETNEDPKNIPEIDGGKTEDSKVVENTDKVHDFFTYLKKSNTYIDKVLVNSTNGESIPLTSVDITITVPKNQNDEFAKMVHKAGLEYHKLEDGKYQLKLDSKVFGGNLVEEDGKIYLKDDEGNKTEVELTKENITDAILEDAGKRVYVDEEGKTHQITKEEYLESENFKVKYNVLYEKDGEDFKEISTFDENGRIEKGDKVYELKGGKLIHYDKVNVYEGKVVNTNDKANPNLTPSPDGKQVIIKNGEEKSYGGTIVDNAFYNSQGEIVKNDDYQGKTGNIIIGDDGKELDEEVVFDPKNIKEENGIKTVKVGDKTYRVVTNPVFNDKGYIVDGLSYAHGPTLVDKYGKRMKIDVTENEDGTYTFTRKVIKNGKEEEESKKTGDNISIADEEVIVDSRNKIVDKSDDNKVIEGKYYYDGEKFVQFTPDEDDLENISKETYTKDDEVVDVTGEDSKYKGSLNPDDYYKAGDDFYVKKTQGSKDYYLSADPNSDAKILSEGELAKIVQTLGEGEDAKEVVTDETSIFDAIKNAKFGLSFPGFLAGKNIVYNVHADVKATYKDEDGKDVSIFEEGSKTADRFFTLKNSKSSETLFFKNNPKELEKIPDYNFFNIFYRNSDDRERDKLIKALLKEKEGIQKSEEKPNEDEELTDEKRAEIKEKTARMALLDKIQKELGRLYDGAEFALDKDGNLIILDKNGEETDIDRSLLWEIGFNNSKDSIFPENNDTEIIIEDHHLDNRLVYDEIIVNDTEANWKKLKEREENLKKAYEEAKKAYQAGQSDANKEKMDAAKKAFEENEFEGSKNYFYLDQIGEINFGVNPSYTEGRFAPIGENFTLTSEEIIQALKKGEESIIKGGIEYKITRDEKKGQVRISVINAFYKKADEKSENKFQSPVQDAYGEKIKNLNTNLDSITTTYELKSAVDTIIDNFVADDSQKDALKKSFEEVINSINNIEGETKKKEALEKAKETLKAELDKLSLSYLDESKGDYKNDDFRFNSIRIALKDGIRLGGPLSPETDKKLGITSVVIPDVDIPYTDEYGKIMTNKYMYVKEEIENIIKNGIEDKKYTKDDLKDEDKYKEILKEAYKRVNDDEEIEIKDLVEIKDKDKLVWEKYSQVTGKDLDYKDLSNIKDKKGNQINPWYIGETPASEKFEAKPDLKNSQAYKDLENKKIDLAAYYMSDKGYDRRTYANKANYKLDKVDQNEGIFGNEDSSKKKSYYPTIGYIIDRISDATNSENEGQDKDADKYGAEGNNDSKFELDYEPESTNSDEENPKVNKSVSEESVDIAGEEEKKVDFTIDVTVDKMTKGQKDLAKAMDDTKDEENLDQTDDDPYNPNGYYVYKNSVIIDILPEIFELRETSKLEIEVDKIKLMANGANAKFDNEENFENFKKSIKYFYTDDLDAEIKRLEAGDENDQKKAEVLRKAKEDSNKNFKDGEKIQAIIAYLPEFEAPHGSTSQFIFKLSNIFIDKKAYKDYDDGIIGTNYTNKAGFGDESKFYYGDRKVNINEGPDGKVNKYLQILDENGDPIEEDEAKKWFKGSANLKFGDKFDYRIKYKHNSGIIQIGNLNYKSELSIKDILAGVEDNGLRPVLRDFVKSDLEGFEVIYKVGDKEYSKKDIEEGKAKLSEVTSLVLKSGKNGYEDGSTVNFYIPMEIPTIDAKIENNELIYIGKNGKEEEIGKASDFFKLEDLKDVEKDLLAENTVEGSNTVKVYLEKERFIRVFKEFLDQNGEEITENRPEVEFEIYQIDLDENGNPIKDEEGNPKKSLLEERLVVNESNKFTDIVKNLPLCKKTLVVKENGDVEERILRYGYEIKEVDAKDYDVEIEIMESEDDLGFVIKAKNAKKPEKPEDPENPNETPEEPEDPEEPEEPEEPGTPEEPEKPSDSENPENPDEKKDKKDKTDKPSNKDKNKEYRPLKPGKPNKPNKPGTPTSSRLPKTGAVTDFAGLYLSGLILLIAIIARKKVRE